MKYLYTENYDFDERIWKQINEKISYLHRREEYHLYAHTIQNHPSI